MKITSKKVFVAFLDILGFKTYILKNIDDLEKVKNYVSNLFSLGSMISTAYVSTARYNQKNQSGHKLEPTKIIQKPDGSNAFTPNLDVSNINSILMFDSIVLWTNNNNEDDLIDLISVVRFMLNSQFSMGFPLRGAISYGEFYFNQPHIPSASTIIHSNLVSPAQIYAMTLEKSQQWSGCVLDQHTVERCKELNVDIDKNKLISAVRYLVPMKKEKQDLYALIWQGQVIEYVGGEHPVNMQEYVRKSFLQNTDLAITPEKTIQDINEKIKNTSDFVNFSIKYLSDNSNDILHDNKTL